MKKEKVNNMAELAELAYYIEKRNLYPCKETMPLTMPHETTFITTGILTMPSMPYYYTILRGGRLDK